MKGFVPILRIIFLKCRKQSPNEALHPGTSATSKIFFMHVLRSILFAFSIENLRHLLNSGGGGHRSDSQECHGSKRPTFNHSENYGKVQNIQLLIAEDDFNSEDSRVYSVFSTRKRNFFLQYGLSLRSIRQALFLVIFLTRTDSRSFNSNFQSQVLLRTHLQLLLPGYLFGALLYRQPCTAVIKQIRT